MAYRRLIGSEFKFINIGGVFFPQQPWPQAFHISAEIFEMHAYEVRPLTVTGFVRGVSRNFVTMNWWRLLFLLWRVGFLVTEEGSKPCVADWRWKFWLYRKSAK